MALCFLARNQETRETLFQEYVNSGRDTMAVEAKFEAQLVESQKTKIRYGFRSEEWLIKHHGEKKAARIMQRKRQLGLKLGNKTPNPEPPCLGWTNAGRASNATPPNQGGCGTHEN